MTNDPHVPIAHIAALIELSERHVTRLAAKGVLPPVNNGKLPLVASLVGFIKFQKTGDGNEMTAAKLRNLTADAEAKERENRLADRLLMPSALALRVWSSVIADLRQKVMYAPLPDDTRRDILKDLQALPIDDYFSHEKQTQNPSDDSSIHPPQGAQSTEHGRSNA